MPRPFAEDAKRKAIARYLAYRRDGGENHEGYARLSRDISEYLLADNKDAAACLLQELATHPDLSEYMSNFIRRLGAIVDGSRDRSLADIQDLNYFMAAEILFLIETLEKRESGK